MTTTVQNPTAIADWYAAVQDDLGEIEDRMREVSEMGFDRLDAAVTGIITSGGKRMRPAMTVLSSRLFDLPTERVYSVAASIELLHTATLVHDDMIDGAQARRGAPTLHSQMSLGVTVLTGDFLFAQAASLAADADSVAIVKRFSDTLVHICKGEILQAQTRWKVPEMGIYLERIYGKTAALFETASVVAAIMSDADKRAYEGLETFGRELGLAFQIVDDALDFNGTTEQLGKPAGNDMRQGIYNLPVMFFVGDGHIDPQTLNHRVEMEDRLDELVVAIREAGMVERSLSMARQHAQNAMDALGNVPQGEAVHLLKSVAKTALARTY